MWSLQDCIVLLYDDDMSEKNNNSVWTDTRGIAEHFDMKPNTLRKQRVKQSPTTLPYHLIGGNVRYNILECEKHVEDNKRDFNA
mgnify:CR=1 FL=1